MPFESVINGIMKYLNREVFPKMNDWQEIVARLAVGRVLGPNSTLKETLVNNTFIQTFGIMDANGNVDVDNLMRDLQEQISAKGKLDLSIPMLGRFTFTSADVDALHRIIKEG